MAMPSIIGTASGGRAGSGAFTITPPASAAGYLAFAQWHGNAAALTPPSGWTTVTEAQTFDEYTWYGWYTATGGAGDSWNYSGTFGAAVVMTGYNGALTLHQSAGSNNSATCPTVTTTEASLLVRAWMVQNFSGTIAVTYPASATLGRITKDQAGGGEAFCAAMAHEERPSAGAVGTAVYSSTGATTWQPRAQTIALTTTAAGPQAASGTVAAVSAAVGSVIAVRPAAGSAPATSTAVGAVTNRIQETGTVAAVSAVAGSVTRVQQVGGTVTALTDVSGVLGVNPALTGSVDALTSVAGSVTARLPAFGVVPGISTTTGAVTLHSSASGTVAVVSDVIGSTATVQPVTGTVAGVAAAQGDVTAALAAAGIVAAVTTVAGSAAMTQTASGTVVVTSAVSGEMLGQGELSGEVAAVSTVSGSVTAQHVASGTVAAVTDADGDVIGVRPAAGSVSAVTSAAGSITRQTSASGVVPATSNVVGAVTATTTASGLVAAVSSVAGQVTITGVLPPVDLPDVLTLRVVPSALTLTIVPATLTVCVRPFGGTMPCLDRITEKRGDTRTRELVLNRDLTGVTPADIEVYISRRGVIVETLTPIIVDAVDGVISIQFTGDLEVGSYKLEVQVTQGSTISTHPTDGWIGVVIEQDLGD